MVPPRDPQALAARITDLLNNRDMAREMGARTPALIRSDFSLDKILDQYVAMYAELLSHRPAMVQNTAMQQERLAQAAE
jgi:glycosyltransferase involved in cell wall biosynthesis